jgi:superfamily I DNA and RNA helicase
VLNRPKTEAMVLSSTTIDDLSGVSCKSGWAVMLDELDVGDKDAVQYMSTGIMKAMCDPQSTTGLRARGKNVVLAGDTARIFTTNATSLDNWAAGRFNITLPIRRKMWVFVIERKMIEDEWAKRNDYVGSELF